MRYRTLILAALVPLIAFRLAVVGRSQTQIKHVPAPQTDIASGVEMYSAYCAVCHGTDGRGNGPATPALKTAPTDLTLLSRRNGGKYPDFKVSNIIKGDGSIPAHGSREMPMWGNVFRELNRDEAKVTLRVHNLTEYIGSLQQP